MIIARILGLPFFAVICLIAAVFLWFKWAFNFIRFGGEAIIYETNSRKTIFDIYQKLETDQKCKNCRYWQSREKYAYGICKVIGNQIETEGIDIIDESIISFSTPSDFYCKLWEKK